MERQPANLCSHFARPRLVQIGDRNGLSKWIVRPVDFVLDRETRVPAPLQASYLVNRLRDCGILTGTDGPHHNVIKLRPPLVFSESNADFFARTLNDILGEDAAQPGR